MVGIDTQWEADLADIQGIARQCNGVRYLLTVIDVFSMYACVAPTKSKDAASVPSAFRAVLSMPSRADRADFTLTKT